MGTIITKSNIESAAYSNIFDVLDDRSNINDPRNSGNTAKVRQFVYDYDPFHKSLDFGLFPYMILELPVVMYSRTSGDGKTKDIQWKNTIRLRSARDGAGNSTSDIGRSDALAICDDINETFNSEAIKQSLRALNMKDIKLEQLGQSMDVIDMKYVYESEFSITYITRLTVSA
jgi:hypothetical protein